MLAYLAIGSLAVLPIYTGSHAALRRPATAPRPTTKEEEEDDRNLISESLSSSDAMLFPVLGGAVLFSLYLLITYVSKEWLNTILNIYFLFMGLVSNTQALHKVATFLFPKVRLLPKYEFKISRGKRDTGDRSTYLTVKISSLYLLLGSVSLVLTVYYAITKNWVVSNIFGLAFAFNGIQLIALDSFKTGMILLSGLFFYDIYFVFGTKVMVTVAKGIEAPIKLTFPKDLLRNPFGPATILGLGDIVIPGIYIAFALRYDLSQYHKQYPRAAYWKGWHEFEQPYFRAAFRAYILGLITTIVVMHLTRAAQPALLYLSPACILSTLITARHRGQLQSIWQYKEEEDAATKVEEDESRLEGKKKS